MKELNMPSSIAECGIDRSKFESKVSLLAEKAFEDQCTTANPRMPLISELEEIYRQAYNG
jgi:acetaldehyde dehydrogenase/alcohol dehydrogenase